MADYAQLIVTFRRNCAISPFPRSALSLKHSLAKAALALAVVLTAGAATADSLSGRVVGLADGDTITVLDSSFVQHKVRVGGIDAPEKGQPFGNRSKSNLSTLVMGKSVQVQGHKKDRYGRVVGLVLVNGLDAGLEQVRSGMAWHYKAYAKEQPHERRVSYAAAEDEARTQHRGLWRDPTPVAPWDYRKAKREAQQRH